MCRGFGFVKYRRGACEKRASAVAAQHAGKCAQSAGLEPWRIASPSVTLITRRLRTSAPQTARSATRQPQIETRDNIQRLTQDSAG